ncbi:MAG: Anaphase-promoting complex subunit 4 domain [Chlamydiota bacterium]|jgi:hypothetical protein
MSIPSTMVLSSYKSASSELLAAGSYNGTISIWNLSDEKDIVEISTGKPPLALSFSPDGQKILVIHSDTLSLISRKWKRILWTKGPFLNGIPTLKWAAKSNKLTSDTGIVYEITGTQYSLDQTIEQRRQQPAAPLTNRSLTPLPAGAPVWSSYEAKKTPTLGPRNERYSLPAASGNKNTTGGLL